MKKVFAKLIFAAVLLGMQFAPSLAQATAPTAVEGAQLMVMVAGSDGGEEFLSETRSMLERFGGGVLSVQQQRDPFLNRPQTMIVFSFRSAEGAQNFMISLAQSEPDETGDTSGSNYSCEPQTTGYKVCRFRFGSYRFVCVQYNDTAGSCVQY